MRIVLLLLFFLPVSSIGFAQTPLIFDYAPGEKGVTATEDSADFFVGESKDFPNGIPPTLWVHPKIKKTYLTDGLILQMLGNPSQLFFRRSGPDNALLGEPPTPLGSGQNIGHIAWEATGRHRQTGELNQYGRNVQIHARTVGSQHDGSAGGALIISATSQGETNPGVRVHVPGLNDGPVQVIGDLTVTGSLVVEGQTGVPEEGSTQVLECAVRQSVQSGVEAQLGCAADERLLSGGGGCDNGALRYNAFSGISGDIWRVVCQEAGRNVIFVQCCS